MTVLLLATFCACQEPRGGEPSKRDASRHDTSLLKRNLPRGRFQLPTRHTPVPNFWITLPEGYTVKAASKLPNDEIYVYRTDDPSLSNAGAVTAAVMRFYVGVRAQSAYREEFPRQERNVVIAGRPLAWTIWTELLPDGRRFYNREITSHDFFAAISPELARTPLHLHIYVGGTDSARVAALAGAAETIGTRP